MQAAKKHEIHKLVYYEFPSGCFERPWAPSYACSQPLIPLLQITSAAAHVTTTPQHQILRGRQALHTMICSICFLARQADVAVVTMTWSTEREVASLFLQVLERSNGMEKEMLTTRLLGVKGRWERTGCQGRILVDNIAACIH